MLNLIPDAEKDESRTQGRDKGSVPSLHQRLFGDRAGWYLGIVLLWATASLARAARSGSDPYALATDVFFFVAILFASAADRRVQTFAIGALGAWLWTMAEADLAILAIGTLSIASVHYLGLRYAEPMREALWNMTRAQRTPTLIRLVSLELANAVLLAAPIFQIARHYLISQGATPSEKHLILFAGFGIAAVIALWRLRSSIPTPIDA